jgi:HD-GYP domain-containing protein (c-di-GMP phosphodiesterase class II)
MKKIITDEETKDLINTLAVVIKTAQIHDINNVAVINATDKLFTVLKLLISSEKLSLELLGEIFYLDESRVRYSMEYSSNFDFLAEEFRKREMGSVVFENTVNEDDIKALALAFIISGTSETPFQTLSKALERVPNIQVKIARKIKEDITEFEKKKLVKKSYSDAVSIIQGVLNKIKAGEGINFKKSKRVIETIVDQIVEEELKAMLIGMTTIKDHDEYTYYHSVNVSIFAIALGYEIGLPRKVLAELGLAAIFHDLGKVEIPIEILNKPSNLSDEDWQYIIQHPRWGAIKIFKMRGIDAASMELAISAFEHHLNLDNSGYPQLKTKIILDLFSKIITIADQYDAMTSSRVYARIPLSPDKALSVMYENRGVKFDPYLLKIFTQMIGIYPIGCLVMLDTNELGLVFENNPDSAFIDRPRVRLITDSSGERVEDFVDLTEKDENGNYKRSITKTLDPNQYNINLAEYLL